MGTESLEMDNTQMEGIKECLGIPAGKMLKTPRLQEASRKSSIWIGVDGS